MIAVRRSFANADAAERVKRSRLRVRYPWGDSRPVAQCGFERFEMFIRISGKR